MKKTKKCAKQDPSEFNGVIVKVRWMDDNKSVRFDFSNCKKIVISKIFAMRQDGKTSIEMEYEP